jgi:hypothetical protein
MFNEDIVNHRQTSNFYELLIALFFLLVDNVSVKRNCSPSLAYKVQVIMQQMNQLSLCCQVSVLFYGDIMTGENLKIPPTGL